MTEWTTLSVKENTLTRFRDIKEQLDETQDAPDHSADSFLNALLDTWDAANQGYYNPHEVAIEDLLDDEAVDPEQLQKELEDLSTHIESNSNGVDDEVELFYDSVAEDLEGMEKRICNRLDDLQSQLPKDVATEIHK